MAAQVTTDSHALAWLLGTAAQSGRRLPKFCRCGSELWRSLKRLADARPGSAGWQRDLAVAHNKIGDVLVEQGDLAQALKSYQASLAIRERLAAADPTPDMPAGSMMSPSHCSAWASSPR